MALGKKIQSQATPWQFCYSSPFSSTQNSFKNDLKIFLGPSGYMENKTWF